MDNEENQELTETAETEATTADARVEEVAVMDEAPVEQEGEGATEDATEDAAPSKSKKKSSPIVMRHDLLEEGEYTPDEYEEMLAMYEDTLSEIAEGEIVKATILRTTETAVILDVGFKSEGAVPLDEFRDPETLEPGQEVDVYLESLEDQEGVVVLSKKKADFLRVWEKIKHAFDNNEAVGGTIKRKIKGGVTVDLMGVDAFLPGSQIGLRRVPNVEDLVGQEFDFKILKLNKRRRNIVVSRRVILEEERAAKRDDLRTELEVGQLRKGIVKNITDFGAFIDLGGMDGLLHITDMSWGRVGHPSEICNIGDELEVKILDIDWDRERISLGLKQLQAYPWEDVAAKYPVGSRVHGRVVSITNYGAFVELEKGVEGLVHISEMSWTRNVRHPSQLVSIGDEIECVVLRVDEEEKKISLGMKQTEEDPWLALPAKYPPGTRIKGVVRNLTSFGAFVEVEPGIDGLVHISDMSWTRRVQHPSEVVRKGEEFEVVVLNIDPEQKRISLGLKQVDEDPWYQLAQDYQPGRELSGTVVRLLEKGVVVDLGSDIEGFVPVSQMGGEEEEVAEPTDKYIEGDALELQVLETDPINRRIVLTVTAGPDRPAGAVAAAADDAHGEDDEGGRGEDDEGGRGEDDEGGRGEDDEGGRGEDDEGGRGEDDEGGRGEDDEGGRGEDDEGGRGADAESGEVIEDEEPVAPVAEAESAEPADEPEVEVAVGEDSDASETKEGS